MNLELKLGEDFSLSSKLDGIPKIIYTLIFLHLEHLKTLDDNVFDSSKIKLLISSIWF